MLGSYSQKHLVNNENYNDVCPLYSMPNTLCLCRDVITVALFRTLTSANFSIARVL